MESECRVKTNRIPRVWVKQTLYSLVREMDAHIHKLVAPGPRPEVFESVLERARLLKTQFAANHPVAERFMAQIMDSLAKIGI